MGVVKVDSIHRPEGLHTSAGRHQQLGRPRVEWDEVGDVVDSVFISHPHPATSFCAGVSADLGYRYST